MAETPPAVRRRRRVAPDPALLGRALLLAGEQAPDALLVVLRQLLAGAGATDVVLWLPDYRQRELRPTSSTQPSPTLFRPVAIGDVGPGRAFSDQATYEQRVPAGVLLHCPATVRGQRMAVLSIALPDPPDDAGLRTAASLAIAAGYLLLEAGRGTDLYDVERRHARLSVAAEMQWQLLPARTYRTPHFDVAGQLEPATHVGGDSFDFSVTGAALQLAIVDAGGESQAASLTATLAVSALRNARRAGLPPAEQAALAGEAVWREYRGVRTVSALLLHLDNVAGRATVVAAGLPALFRVRAGELERLDASAQAPLGALPDDAYDAHAVDLVCGDRAVVLTDGALVEPGGLPPVDLRLLSRLSPAEAVRRVVTGLRGGRAEPEDDATVVCVDWLAVS